MDAIVVFLVFVVNGCYKSLRSDRVRNFPILLKSFRDEMNWEDMKSFERIVMKCADLARQKNHKVI